MRLAWASVPESHPSNPALRREARFSSAGWRQDLARNRSRAVHEFNCYRPSRVCPMHPRYHVVVALADVREPLSNLLADQGHLEPVAGAVGVDQEEFLASDRALDAALDDHVAALVGDSSDGQDGAVRAIRAARSPRDADAAVVEEEEGSQGKPEDRERCR